MNQPIVVERLNQRVIGLARPSQYQHSRLTPDAVTDYLVQQVLSLRRYLPFLVPEEIVFGGDVNIADADPLVHRDRGCEAGHVDGVARCSFRCPDQLIEGAAAEAGLAELCCRPSAGASCRSRDARK
jgi:hypothetical protein